MLIDVVIIVIMYKYSISTCVTLFCTSCLNGGCFWLWISHVGVYWFSSLFVALGHDAIMPLAKAVWSDTFGLQLVTEWYVPLFGPATHVSTAIFYTKVAHYAWVIHVAPDAAALVAAVG